MKKISLISLLILVFVGPLMGQTKEINYGYKPLPIREMTSADSQFISQHYYHRSGLAKVSELPLYVNWTNFMPPAGDQGTDGSCTGFAVSYAISQQQNMKTGYSPSNTFSPAFIFNMHTGLNPQGQQSGTPISAVYVDIIAGCAKESEFPYIVGSYEVPNLEIQRNAMKYKGAGFGAWYVGDTIARPDPGSNPIPVPGYLGINEAKRLLAEGKPVIMTFMLTDGFGGEMISENWIYSYDAYKDRPYVGAHAMTVVGYNDTLQTRDTCGAFRVINSWGADKFDNGYLWITYKAMAMMQYHQWFYTFEHHDDFQTKGYLEFQFEDFGSFLNLHAGLKVGSQEITQNILGYRGGNRSQLYFTQAVADISDLAVMDLSEGGEFFLKGMWLDPGTFWTTNPKIKSIRVVIPSQHVDTLLVTNLEVTPDQITELNGFYHWTAYPKWNIRRTVTGVETDPNSQPTAYALAQNYPNPFNPSTTIDFSTPKTGKVTLKVYNLLGQEVATLVDEELSSGNHSVKFDATGLSSGLYLYTIEAGSFREAKKMLFTK